MEKGIGEKYCAECGKIIKEKAELCVHCGVRQAPPVGEKSKIAAFLLAFLLGGFGAHKFYLGKPGLGVLYLLFFWTFIPGIIALVEAILLITMSDHDFHARFNTTG